MPLAQLLPISQANQSFPLTGTALAALTAAATTSFTTLQHAEGLEGYEDAFHAVHSLLLAHTATLRVPLLLLLLCSMLKDLKDMETLSELGVLFLLYEQGLELSLDRLKVWGGVGHTRRSAQTGGNRTSRGLRQQGSGQQMGFGQ
jgi:hypothetical protein